MKPFIAALSDFTEKDWEQLINGFYCLKDGLEEISEREPSGSEYVAVLYSFGHFYNQNQVELEKCLKVFEEMRDLKDALEN